jgi:predicted dehydrogenase
LGYNELKTLEVLALIQALAGTGNKGPDFAEALEIERLATAIRVAAKEMRWVKVADI